MNRRGDQSTTYWVVAGVIAAALVVIYFTGVLPKFLELIGLPELIPTLGLGTVPQGNGVIGLRLDTKSLEYYTGDEFRKFSDEKVSVLAGYEFNIEDTKNKINDFYFKTERRPTGLKKSINHWRYIDIYRDDFGEVRITPYTKSGFEGPGLIGYGLLKPSDNQITVVSLRPASEFDYYPEFFKIEILPNKELINEIISWRDSILQGNKCEKFLTLRVKQNGAEKDLNYTVRNVDGYLTLDLSKPVTPGLAQDWDKTGCFKFDNYADNPLKNPADVKVNFFYTNYNWWGADADEKASWSKQDGWVYYSLSRGQFVPYFYHSEYSKFYPELVNYLAKPNGYFYRKDTAFNYERNDQGVFFGDSTSSLDILFIKGKEWDEIDVVQVDEFIYRVLSEYNKNLILKGQNE
ncbi:MAG: hypothetical protein AABW71_01835 [Nanoarchaeota archaeon]